MTRRRITITLRDETVKKLFCVKAELEKRLLRHISISALLNAIAEIMLSNEKLSMEKLTDYFGRKKEDEQENKVAGEA